MLHHLPLEIRTIGDYPGLVMPEEDQDTFADNAVKKAEAVSHFTGHPAMADDSGLEVEALGGRPGIYSARYAGADGDYLANNRLLLKELQGIPTGRRNGRFVCAIAVAVPGDQTYVVEESCPGRIAEKPDGVEGFGYDPLFIYEPKGITFARMSPEEKNSISHRGRALRRAVKLLRQLLEQGSL